MEYAKFSIIDYALFSIMIGLSGAVGIYFGYCGKQDTAKDYLHGGKQMKVFPVAMSLVASTLSGISLLGVPAEVYMHGTQFWMMILSIFILGFIVNYIYLPVFYKLQLTSVFEYLEIRFERKVRSTASAVLTIAFLIGLPVIIYAPSLAFNQVTGFNIHLVALILSSICIFYTTIGGVKAVVWTDTLQFCVTLCTLGFVLVLGTISVGGVKSIWEKAEYGNRLEFFNMDLDPTVRSTFWNVVFGNLCLWASFMGTSQGTVQRFLAVPTFRDSQKILVVFVIFTIITKSISCFSGLIMYAKYYDCDPLTAGLMSKPDQILPYYVLDVASQIPGLSGLFVSGLFSTALSTLSTFLNSLAATMYEDFISPLMPANTTERRASTIMKVLTLVTGCICVSLIFVVEKLGSILQLALTLGGITAGPILGVFTLGMVFPTTNEKGAFCGLVGSIIFMFVIIVKNQYLIWNGIIKATPKPLYTYGCNLTSTLSSVLNETVTASTSSYFTTLGSVKDCSPEEPFWLFRVSFYGYLVIGTVLTLAIGLIVSWITKSKDSLPVNPDLLSPCIHRFLNRSTTAMRYSSVEKEIHIKMNGESTELKEPVLDKLLKE